MSMPFSPAESATSENSTTESNDTPRSRKHGRVGADSDDRFKSKILETLTTKQSAGEAFATSISFTLNKFSDVNQEFVKIQIQSVLAQSLRCQVENLPMPTFKAE
jgi:hypothetical protein